MTNTVKALHEMLGEMVDDGEGHSILDFVIVDDDEAEDVCISDINVVADATGETPIVQVILKPQPSGNGKS